MHFVQLSPQNIENIGYFVAIVCSSSLAEKSNVYVVATGAPFVHVHVLMKLYFHAKLVWVYY